MRLRSAKRFAAFVLLKNAQLFAHAVSLGQLQMDVAESKLCSAVT